MMRRAGGEYVFMREAYGPRWAAVYGWTQIWITQTASQASKDPTSRELGTPEALELFASWGSSRAGVDPVVGSAGGESGSKRVARVAVGSLC